MCSCCGQSSAGVHTITDASGRAWTFENTRMFGPFVLGKNGDPLKRQPGRRSRFWAAYDEWKRGLA